MDGLPLGDEHQPRRRHVQAVNDHRPRRPWIPLAQACLNAVGDVDAGDGEELVRLHDHQQIIVFVDHVEILAHGGIHLQGAGLYVHAFQHMAQDGAALPVAGRIVIAVAAQLSLGALSPPELRQRDGPVAPLEGVLEELRGGALPGPGGRDDEDGFGEDGVEVPPLPPRVQEGVVGEDAALEVVGHLLAQLLEFLDAVRHLGQSPPQVVELLRPVTAQIPEGEVAQEALPGEFFVQGGVFFLGDLPPGGFPAGGAFFLGGFEGLAFGGDLGGGGLFGFGQGGAAGVQFRIGQAAVQLVVDGHDFAFPALVEGLGVEEVVDGGDEARVVVSVGQFTGEGGEVAQVSGPGLHDQNAEHLAAAGEAVGVSEAEVVVEVRLRPQVLAQGVGSGYGNGVRDVVVGVGELVGEVAGEREGVEVRVGHGAAKVGSLMVWSVRSAENSGSCASRPFNSPPKPPPCSTLSSVPSPATSCGTTSGTSTWRGWNTSPRAAR